MTWLLDTCVLSEYIKKTPAATVIQWLDEQNEDELYISVVNLGEIEKGIFNLRVTDAIRSKKLTTWFETLKQRFAGRILPLDAATLHDWAQLTAGAEIGGRCLPIMDGLIMATAQHHDLTVVTRNTGDFCFYPRVFDPWRVR
ncbi:MAG: type II toxin-antitoxin system VapC family toxin [Rhodocyclaceae bacterium]|nr:type II toxin-antitoxin system VapC family toxin [Rhodocyclaceae bacterium]